MTQIGKLRPLHPGGLAEFAGHIDTIEDRYVVRITGDETLYDGRHPSHRIICKTRLGTELEIGQGWLKTILRGPRSGERFLSITIDFPGLQQPLNVAAFRDESGEDWTVTWRRRGSPTAQNEIA